MDARLEIVEARPLYFHQLRDPVHDQNFQAEQQEPGKIGNLGQDIQEHRLVRAAC